MFPPNPDGRGTAEGERGPDFRPLFLFTLKDEQTGFLLKGSHVPVKMSQVTGLLFV